jgi:hypothetical protein
MKNIKDFLMAIAAELLQGRIIALANQLLAIKVLSVNGVYE